MTDDHIQSVRDDIAYMRAMAEEGRSAPLLSGPIMVAAAVIFGGASVGQWAIQSGVLDVTPWAQLWLWIGSGVLFAAALTVLIRRLKRKPGCHSAGNTAVGVAWSGVGFAIFSIWLSMMAIGFAAGDWGPMRLMPSVVFSAYGTAWLVAGAMSRLKWMNLVAVLSYGGAVVMGVVSLQPEGYLVFAALLMAVALLPGLALMRQEPAEVI